MLHRVVLSNNYTRTKTETYFNINRVLSLRDFGLGARRPHDNAVEYHYIVYDSSGKYMFNNRYKDEDELKGDEKIIYKIIEKQFTSNHVITIDDEIPDDIKESITNPVVSCNEAVVTAVENNRESDGELATIEKGNVVVDWGGSLISKNDVIDFGDSDFIDITDINKDYMYPNYIGYEMTIDDYINNFDLIRFLIRGYEY